MNNNPSKNEIDFVRESLLQFNNSCVGDDGHAPLNLIEYDAHGNIIAGIIGGTYWGFVRLFADQYPKLKFREPMGAASPVE